MDNVVDMSGARSRKPSEVRTPASGSAEIFLFTGVRYERWDEPAPVEQPRRTVSRKTVSDQQ